MLAIEIERGVPLHKPPSGRKPRFPFAQMTIGDSFWAPQPTVNTRAWMQKSGWQMTSRSEVKDGVKGTRVWRIA